MLHCFFHSNVVVEKSHAYWFLLYSHLFFFFWKLLGFFLYSQWLTLLNDVPFSFVVLNTCRHFQSWDLCLVVPGNFWYNFFSVSLFSGGTSSQILYLLDWISKSRIFSFSLFIYSFFGSVFTKFSWLYLLILLWNFFLIIAFLISKSPLLFFFS